MGRMKSYLAILKATALEILSEPLTLLVLLASLVLTIVMPVFHYHQFGEATRMARDAGASALLMCGGVVAIFGTIRAFRREIETGTLEMALAHPISRTGFFLAKAAGSFLAYLAFAVVVSASSATSVIGAAVGGHLAEKSGDLARVWGPCVAAGMVTMVGSLVLAAFLNRFARCRFVLSSFALMFLFSLGGAVGFSFYTGETWALRLLPVVILLVVLTALWVAVASTAAVRLKAHAAASATGLFVLAMIPFLGNYYRIDALSNGGVLPWFEVMLATLALVPAYIGFLVLGMRLCREMN